MSEGWSPMGGVWLHTMWATGSLTDSPGAANSLDWPATSSIQAPPRFSAIVWLSSAKLGQVSANHRTLRQHRDLMLQNGNCCYAVIIRALVSIPFEDHFFPVMQIGLCLTAFMYWWGAGFINLSWPSDGHWRAWISATFHMALTTLSMIYACEIDLTKDDGVKTCRSGVWVQVEVGLGLAIQEHLEEPDILVPDRRFTISRPDFNIEESACQLQIYKASFKYGCLHWELAV